MAIKRYDPIVNVSEPDVREHPNGDYVEYDDYAALVEENRRLREALETIASTNQVREFTGNDKSDGYGDSGWITYDGQYAKIARSALAQGDGE